MMSKRRFGLLKLEKGMGRAELMTRPGRAGFKLQTLSLRHHLEKV